MSKYVYGIDLGTTYSCIAYQDESGRPVVLKNVEGSNTTPSVVQFSEDGKEVIVGQVAKDTAVLEAPYTIQFVKRKMGKEKEVPYGPEDAPLTKSPIEISSYILKKLAADAGEANDDEVTDVVITCPAYFGDEERNATREAGKAAGLNVLSLIDEPTAAAIYYGLTTGENKTVMVYDLGGGTFDISIIKVEDGKIKVICTDGDHDLGGENWDKEVSAYIAGEFEEQTGFSGDYDEEALQDMALKVERAKIQLSGKEKTKIMFTTEGYKGKIELTRETFDSLTQSLRQSTIDLTTSVLELAKEKYGIDHIDEFLLVGGSSRMPQIDKAIKNALQIEPKMLDPEEAVAKGAAMYAAIESYRQAVIDYKKEHGPIPQPNPGESDDEETPESIFGIGGKQSALPQNIDIEDIGDEGSIIETVTSKSFGIEVIDKNDKLLIANMIIKNSKTPADITQTFSTVCANQNTVQLTLYESTYLDETYDVDNDLVLGEAELELPPNLPKGSPIDVTLRLSSEGTLEMTGREPSSNREVHATFTSDIRATDEELEEIQQNVNNIKLSN